MSVVLIFDMPEGLSPHFTDHRMNLRRNCVWLQRSSGMNGDNIPGNSGRDSGTVTELNLYPPCPGTTSRHFSAQVKRIAKELRDAGINRVVVNAPEYSPQ